MEKSKEVVIDTKKMCKSYTNGELQQHIIKNMDIQIYSMDFTVFMGPSGSGKSTLLYLLSGMDKVSMGEIYFKGTNFTKYSEKQLARFRKINCGYVFQQIHLINSMNLMDNVLVSGLLVEKNKQKIVERGKKLFEEVGLTEKEWRKYPSQISGGQMGRAGIVRALINNPEVVFADEPTSGLDAANAKQIEDILINSKKMVIHVTHNLDKEILQRYDEIICMQNGRVVGIGNYDTLSSQNSCFRKLCEDYKYQKEA